MDDVIQLIKDNLSTLGAVVVIIVLGGLVYILARRGLGLLVKSGVAEPIVRMLRLFLRWFFVGLILLLVMQQLGVLQNVWSALIAVMAMVAVGFIAVWSILSNILATLLILIYKPFRIGDSIEIPSESLAGEVEDLNLMYTTLKDEEGYRIQIPNNLFFQKALRRKPGDGDVGLYEQLSKKTN